MDGYIYDAETLRNCTVFVFQHYKDPSIEKVFVIHELRNDFIELMDFLENSSINREYHIGFNNLGFDGQLTTSLIKNRLKLEKLSPEKIAGMIYKKAQKIIDEQEFGDNKFSGLPEWQLSIKQIDVFKINHWDNPNRRASLKWLQYTMDWFSVMEMPIHHGTWITTMEEIDLIIEYCRNDVRFTGRVYERTVPMLQIRKDIRKKYGLKCLNYSDAKLGSELLLKMYSKKTGKKKPDIKLGRTHRSAMKVSEILFPYVKFRSDGLNRVLDFYKNTIITSTKGEVKTSGKLKNYRFDYGAGGIHQCTPGTYHTDDLYSVEDIDVTGLYPNIGCANKMYPAHLGPEFYEVYKEDIVDVRTSEKAKGDKGDQAIVSGFKLAANAAVGNTNQKFSWLYDPQYNMQTTINGQLMISMLVEDLLLELTDVQLIQTNTDGATLRVLKTEVDKMRELCKSWEVTTGLQLEYAKVKSVWTFDVNNYLLLYENGKIKPKGRFEYENLEPHKNKSFLVIAKAIKEYLINGVIPEDYLKTNTNIFDYCGGARVNQPWDFVSTCIIDGQVVETPAQKVVRYYISNQGCKIVKVNREDQRRINVIAGKYLQTEMNLYKERPFEEYGIDFRFYLDAIYKEIGALSKVDNQLELFS